MLICLVSLTNCASIVDGSRQSVSVKTVSAHGDIPGASCQLDSNKGTWFIITPGSVTVQRSADALNAKCTKDGYLPGVTTIKSSTKATAFGNIIFGGLIGAGIDMSTGAAYDYPALITVPMEPVTNDTKPTNAVSAPSS